MNIIGPTHTTSDKKSSPNTIVALIKQDIDRDWRENENHHMSQSLGTIIKVKYVGLYSKTTVVK
jgi:hypothetical protein